MKRTYNYKKTLDAVHMPPEHKQQMRTALAFQFADKLREENTMNASKRFEKSPTKKIKTILIASAAVLSLALLVGFANGRQIIELLGGGRYMQGIDESGQHFASVDMGFDAPPAEVRGDEVYFVLDGSDTNITASCTAETYYQYEQIAADGVRRVVLVGGRADELGWAEFLFSAEGTFLGSNAAHPTEEVPLWLQKGQQTLCG